MPDLHERQQKRLPESKHLNIDAKRAKEDEPQSRVTIEEKADEEIVSKVLNEVFTSASRGSKQVMSSSILTNNASNQIDRGLWGLNGGLKGGSGNAIRGNEDHGKSCHSRKENDDDEPPPKKSVPPLLQGYFESSKRCQRPLPLDQPRAPDMECGNTTADVIENEDGCEIFSPWKEQYQRTNDQMKAVIDAKADQRKSGGGVYQGKEQGNHFLSIQKGYSSKNIGLKLETLDAGNMKTDFWCFALMKYESFEFSKGDPEVRIRKEQPKSTSTGYIWHGYGSDFPSPTSSVQCKIYAYCERSGERDIHFSENDCGRITEAPGASQHLCCSQSCGVVFWHFSQKQFSCESGQWKEELQNDFALVKFGTGREELIWTQWSPEREPTRTRWVRLENSPVFDGVPVDTGAKQRLENFLKGNHLPAFNFPQLSYGPIIQHWREQETLRRETATSNR